MGAQARALVSVVIPCGSQTQYVPDAVKSAISHDFPAEVVVVDGPSTGGPAAARNRGVANARGEFIIILDAGDRLLPGAIDAGARALSARPECAMAYGRCAMAAEDGTIWPTPEPPAVLSGHHAALLRTNLIWMPAMAILRRDAVIGTGGYALGFDAATDYDLYLRLTSRHPVCDHGHLVAAYRRRSDATGPDAGRLLRDTLAAMHRNRPVDPKLQSAWNEGYRNWQEFYGTHLAEDIRAHMRARSAWPAFRKALTLAHLAPHVFTRELPILDLIAARCQSVASDEARWWTSPGQGEACSRTSCCRPPGPAR